MKLIPKKSKIKASAADVGLRLDAVILEHLGTHSRSQIKKWIDEGMVKVNGIIKKTSYKIKKGDKIELDIKPPKELSAEAQNIALDILYEDKDIVVVNKSAGMVVHPAAGNPDGTLVNALLYHCTDLSGIGGVLRPGIVHRLDKGTSGVIVVAKNDLSHLSVSKQFKDRKTSKIYKALLFGVPKKSAGTIDLEIGRHPVERKKMSTKSRSGRSALTHWKLIENFGRHISLVEVRIVTGRTHQIRVHFAAEGMPLVGDLLYGGKKTAGRLPKGACRDIVACVERPLLHSCSISFTHPRSGDKLTFSSDLPEDFSSVLEALREVN